MEEVVAPLDKLLELLSWTAPVVGNKPYLSDPPRKTRRGKKYLDGASWRASGSNWSWLLANPLRNDRPEKPRTLVCHDMMDGYLQDRFINGTDQDGYYFRHWSSLDIFVYFSHHFITIPPPGWIAAAQVHGVLVLGTIITEWDAGKVIVDELLRHPDKMAAFVDKCGQIAEYYGFQGWLFNIENPVDAELVPALIQLVSNLRQRMKMINPNNLVLWYDSVTVQGKLAWQDELNGLNKAFFDICDGIFLNYTWKTPDCSDPPIDSLENSLRALEIPNVMSPTISSDTGAKTATHSPATLSTASPQRRTDIYVGIDVFGRGCLGGGGFSCNVALERVREKGMSAAIFAPGWTYEIPFKENRRDQFCWRENVFWELLSPCLNFHGPMLSPPAHQADSLQPQLLFSTGFCSGRGPSPPWYNLTYLEHQPSLPACSQSFIPDSAPFGYLPNPGTHTTALYACYTSDDPYYRRNQSLFISSKNTGTAVPLFLLDLTLQGGNLLFVVVVTCQSKDEEEGGGVECQLLLATEQGVELRPSYLGPAETARMLEEWKLDRPEEKEGWKTIGFLLEGCSAVVVEKIGIQHHFLLDFNIGLFNIYYR